MVNPDMLGEMIRRHQQEMRAQKEKQQQTKQTPQHAGKHNLLLLAAKALILSKLR